MARDYVQIIKSILDLVEGDPEASAFLIDLNTLLRRTAYQAPELAFPMSQPAVEMHLESGRRRNAPWFRDVYKIWTTKDWEGPV